MAVHLRGHGGTSYKGWSQYRKDNKEEQPTDDDSNTALAELHLYARVGMNKRLRTERKNPQSRDFQCPEQSHDPKTTSTSRNGLQIPARARAVSRCRLQKKQSQNI